jgi:hypothetical protein
MEGWPDPPFLRAEGPEFLEQVKRTNELVARLEDARWDFDAVPEIFARASAACDVAAKEIVSVFDGEQQTRWGRLVIKGAGARFNLMSHESPLARYVGARPSVFADVNRQVGSKGLNDFPEFADMGAPQEVQFFNPTVFYQLKDVVFWNALNGFQLFPSGFEDVRRMFASGNVIRNVIFSPSAPSRSAWEIGDSEERQPIFMEGISGVQFPTSVVEWMPKPLYGGMSTEALHIETLLTTEQTDLGHPYLELVAEGRLRLDDQTYFMRRFMGISQKDALRGPGVPPEGAL